MPTNEETPTTSFLLRLLQDEIARDGGACLATTLKDYVIDSKAPLEVHTNGKSCCNKSKKRRNQQLNSLLVNSNVGKPKLLAFLESHPSVFTVERKVIPHWVLLVNAAKAPSTNTQVFPHRETLRTKVFQKVLYVLRKRQARIERRKTKTQDAANVEADHGVFTHWLLRQCCWEVHFLLRHCDFYRDPTLCGYYKPSDVKQVGSRDWEDVVLPVFEGLLRAGRENTTSCNDNGNVRVMISSIRIVGGKAWLLQSGSEEEHQEQQVDVDDFNTKFDYIIRPADEPNRCEEKQEDDDAILGLVRRIDQTLTDIVCRKDGGHQVSLSLILHRYPDFKELLGGRDLWTLYNEFSKDEDASFFSSISMFYNGTNLILRSKRSKTIDGNDGNNKNKNSLREKRMMVDEEGLYSVTNNKWGRAMSNLVIQACRQKNLFGDSVARIENDKQEVESKSQSFTIKTVIDLTASVGGMTLGLAKSNYFDRVIALEIDQGRAALCKENLSRHGFHDIATNNTSIVEVRHQDSVEQIPFLPRGACFVIDPPWGGYDYKEKVRRQQAEGRGQVLKLGDASLEEVLGLMARHNAPCVVGLRLPTNFAAMDFLTALRDTNIEFECLTRRKISVQLFVVLYFPPSAEFN